MRLGLVAVVCRQQPFLPEALGASPTLPTCVHETLERVIRIDGRDVTRRGAPIAVSVPFGRGADLQARVGEKTLVQRRIQGQRSPSSGAVAVTSTRGRTRVVVFFGGAAPTTISREGKERGEEYADDTNAAGRTHQI